MLYSDFTTLGGVLAVTQLESLSSSHKLASGASVLIASNFVESDHPTLPPPELARTNALLDLGLPVLPVPPKHLMGANEQQKISLSNNLLAVGGPDFPAPPTKLSPQTVGTELVLLDAVPPDFTPPPKN